MDASPDEARRDLETIRGLMERARHYRHLPPQAPLLAGLLALGGGYLTHRRFTAGTVMESLGTLGLVWGGILVLSLGVQLWLSYLAGRREGCSFWSPLAAEIVHVLWPPLLVGVALTVTLVRYQNLELVAPFWILLYGVGAVASGAYARPAVRVLGLGFLVVGLIDLVHPFPPGLVLGVTFGLFHLIYGTVLYLRPARG